MQKNNANQTFKKGIYFETKPVQLTRTGIFDYFINKLKNEKNSEKLNSYKASKHAYLIKYDGKGNEEIIRAGSVENDGILGLTGQLPIEIQKGVSLEKSYDKYEKGSKLGERTSIKLNIPEEQQDSFWNEMLNDVEEIEKLDPKYINSLSSDRPIQNSNSTIGTLLTSRGQDLEKVIPEDLKDNLPGLRTNLLEDKNIEKTSDVANLLNESRKVLNIGNDIRKGRYKDAIDGINNFNNQNTPASPLLSNLNKYRNPEKDVLFKKTEDLTESEVNKVYKHAAYEERDIAQRNKHLKTWKDWHDNIYGTESKKDATGKMLRPTPIKPIPTEEKPLTTKDGLTIEDGFENITKNLQETDAKLLQKSLNKFASVEPKLKEDGDIGPKTTTEAKKVLINEGSKAIEDNLNELRQAEEERKEKVERLEKERAAEEERKEKERKETQKQIVEEEERQRKEREAEAEAAKIEKEKEAEEERLEAERQAEEERLEKERQAEAERQREAAEQAKAAAEKERQKAEEQAKAAAEKAEKEAEAERLRKQQEQEDDDNEETNKRGLFNSVKSWF